MESSALQDSPNLMDALMALSGAISTAVGPVLQRVQLQKPSSLRKHENVFFCDRIMHAYIYHVGKRSCDQMWAVHSDCELLESCVHVCTCTYICVYACAKYLTILWDIGFVHIFAVISLLYFIYYSESAIMSRFTSCILAFEGLGCTSEGQCTHCLSLVVKPIFRGGKNGLVSTVRACTDILYIEYTAKTECLGYTS